MDSEILDPQARQLEATRRLQALLSFGSGQDATSAGLDDLKAKLAAVVEQLHETRHRLLTSQDNFVGSEAEIARLRRQLEVEIGERSKLQHECQSLQDLLSEMKASVSWRIGNAIVSQVRWLTGLGRKR
jgi:chromosome segregation ATPase